MTHLTKEITETLNQVNAVYKEHGKELLIKCLFNGCDDDSRPNEYHLYMSQETGEYKCFKCSNQGNLVTLRRHFGLMPEKKQKAITGSGDIKLSESARIYLHERGITVETATKYGLYDTKYRGDLWLSLPISTKSGEYSYEKIRKHPDSTNTNQQRWNAMSQTQKKGWEGTLYPWDMLRPEDSSPLIITEGELDALMLISQGYRAISNTTGAGTWQQNWSQEIPKVPIIICYDNDEPGTTGSLKVAESLYKEGRRDIRIAKVPTVYNEKPVKDITEYFVASGNIQGLLDEAIPYPDLPQLKSQTEMGIDHLQAILSETIIQDNTTKTLAFLAILLNYTRADQQNIIMMGASSSGKSYIVSEILKLFPKEDRRSFGNMSPAAIFHNKDDVREDGTVIINLEKIIYFFQDMPNSLLMERLRPLLSHDDKEIRFSITDKETSGGNRTKEGILLGFPTFIYCTAGQVTDTQELSRALVLSPSVNQKKLALSLSRQIDKESLGRSNSLDKRSDEWRKLQERIVLIRDTNISGIKLEDTAPIEKLLLHGNYQATDQRTTPRILATAKALALLNWNWRNFSDAGELIATREDAEAACKLWRNILESQRLALPSQAETLFRETIIPLWDKQQETPGLHEESKGLSVKEIALASNTGDSRFTPRQVRTLLESLEASGLVSASKRGKEKVISVEKRLGEHVPEDGDIYSEDVPDSEEELNEVYDEALLAMEKEPLDADYEDRNYEDLIDIDIDPVF